MRQERTVQADIFDLDAGHEIGRELKAMSQVAGLVIARCVRVGGGEFEPARRQGDRAAGLAGGIGAALRAAQAAPSVELRGTGVSS